MAYPKLTQHSLTNDMSKQGFVSPGRVAPPGVNSQNMFTPTQNLRGQPPNYFTNATQNVQTPRTYPLTSARPQTMPLIYGLTGQTTGQAYTASPGTPVIMNANPVMTYPSAQQRIQTPPFTNQPQQSVQQFQMAPAANPQYYPQTPPTTNPMYYQQAQPFPVSPQRPPSAAAVQNTPSYQRRQRTIIQIIDPNTGKDISEEILNNRSTADGSLSGSQMSSDMRAQFAAQVAATLKTGPVAFQYQLPMQQVQNVPPPVQQQQQVQLTQQIQSHPAVAQAPQVPHTQTQVHQLASVQQQPAPPPPPPPPQPGLPHAPISHISPRPVTPQSQPQPQRRQPSKSPPAAIGSIPAPVQNLKDTGCIVFQTGISQSQELMATQSHTLSSPLSLQESPLSIRPSSPVQNKAPQIAPSPTPPGALQASSQLATPVVPQLAVVPRLATPVVPQLATQVIPQLMPLPVVPSQTAQPVVVPQLPQPVAASQPLPLSQTIVQVSQVAPKQPLQQVVSQPPPQLAPPQTIPPVTPVTPQQPSVQVSQTTPMQIPQIPLQQPQQQPLLQASQQQTTPEVPVSNQPTQVTQQIQKKKPSLSPPVEIAAESAGRTDSTLIPTGSKFVPNVDKNNGDTKVQLTPDFKKEISPPPPTSPSPPPISQIPMFEKPAENKGDRLSPKSIKLEIETEQKPVTDDKDSARVPSPSENSKVNEDYTAKDLKKDKPKKKKEEIAKKVKSKEELETETLKDSEPSSVQEPKEQDREKQCASPNDVVTVVETKEEKPVEDEEDITKVEIKIEDKIVAKENEKNEAKNNEDEEENIDDCEDNSLRYRYKDDQWSPLNPDGKKQYDRDFLLELQFSDESLSKPSGLPDLPDVILMKPHTQEATRTYEKTGIHQSPSSYDFTPGYVKSSKPSSSGGSMTKRGSQQGSGRKEIKKIMNVCMSSDVPLNKCENAWKPSYKVTKETEDEEINRKVRSILNKLTPQKFQILLTQIQEIQIDTENKLKVVIDLLFEKAISEPSFSVAYAKLCRYLTLLRVPSATKPGEDVNFRGVLLTRCQKEFEKDTAEEATLSKKRQEIETAKSEEKKNRLTVELEEEFSAAKRRSIGNIRFIGELFKLKMLTENIMHECVFKLLRSKDEENFECLCRLLKTIGKELDLEVAKPRMDQYFHQMKKIVSERKTSSRVRFMLQDVMELRECKWKPRRAEDNPKTIEQIHAEAAQEDKEKKIMLEHAAAQQRTSHHRSGGNGGNRGNQGQRGAVGGDDGGGWNTVSSKQLRTPLDLTKLRLPKQQKIDNSVQLGPSGGNLSSWARGSSGGGLKGSQESERPNPANRFSALSGSAEEGRGRVYGRGGVSPARGDVMARTLQSSTTGSSTRGKMMSRSSQEGDKDKERIVGPSRNMHSSSGRATPPSRGPSRESSRSRDVRPSKEEAAESQAPPVKELSETEIKNKTKAIMDEYLHLTDIQEATQCVTEIKDQPNLYCFVSKALEYVLERSAVSRRQTGLLLHNLVKGKIIDVEIYLKGLNEILEFAEDMEIDIPMIWTYLGELLGVMVNDESVPLNFLKEACKPLRESDKAKILVAEILHDASHQLGHRKVGELWRSSGLKWSDFMNKDEVDEFIKEKKLDFTLSADAPQPNREKISIEKIKEELNNLLLTPKAKNEEIFDWIDANVPEEMTKQSPFIRALMTAVCSSAISGLDSTAKVEEQLIKERCKLLQKYLCNQTLQLQALYALQALDHQLEHPQSVLKSIFNLLCDEEVISEEAFNNWEKSDDPAEQEGKGVALKQVVQFFTWLQNYNDDS